MIKHSKNKPIEKGITEEDTITTSIDHLIEDRIPWLFAGLFGGILATIIVSKYEAILTTDIRLAFFIPIIVYLSDAVGTQTETIYVREIYERKKNIHFTKYIFKESMVGLWLGAISGLVIGIFAAYWLQSVAIGVTVGLTTLINLTSAPILAVIIPTLLYKRHADPALGSGPVATVIQDLISLLVYFLIASIIVL